MLRYTSIIGLAIGASLLGVAESQADRPVSRRAAILPVGTTGGQFNFVGVPFKQEPVATGTVSAYAPGVVTAAAAPSGDFVSTPHILEITTGVAAGITRSVTAVSGAAITVDSVIAGLGADAGYAQFAIIPANTLNSVFGADNGAGLVSGTSAGASDIVYIENNGSFESYFFRTRLVFEAPSAQGWRSTGAPGAGDPDAGDTVVPATAGLLIEKRGAGAGTIPVTGVINSTQKGVQIEEGFNATTFPFAADTTLDDSGLEDVLNSGTSAGASDIVYVVSGSGAFESYFFRTRLVFEPPTAEGWRSTAAPGAGDADEGGLVIPAGAGILIERRTGTGSTDWAPEEAFATGS